MSTVRLLLPWFCLAACTYPRFEASKVVEFSVPATDLHTIHCRSHNGGVHAVGNDDGLVRVRVELRVRGHTQADADANLELLEVGREQAGGRLGLSGRYPEWELNDMSPAFAFTLHVPPRVTLQLESHNGDLRAEGVSGPLQLATHNGNVTVTVLGRQAEVTSHNGEVVAAIDGDGAAEANLESHNGDVVVVVNGNRDAAVTATTHNGAIDVSGPFVDARRERSTVQARLGSAAGRLAVTTHNGNVTLR